MSDLKDEGIIQPVFALACYSVVNCPACTNDVRPTVWLLWGHTVCGDLARLQGIDDMNLLSNISSPVTRGTDGQPWSVMTVDVPQL